MQQLCSNTLAYILQFATRKEIATCLRANKDLHNKICEQEQQIWREHVLHTILNGKKLTMQKCCWKQVYKNYTMQMKFCASEIQMQHGILERWQKRNHNNVTPLILCQMRNAISNGLHMVLTAQRQLALLQSDTVMPLEHDLMNKVCI